MATIDRPKSHVIWMWGPTGVGKSHFANKLFPHAYPKSPQHKWWDSYAYQNVVLVDNFNESSVKLSEWLAWFDKYKCLVETKGGEMALHAQTFIVMGNKDPREIYPHNTKALLRRLEVFHVSNRDQLEEVREALIAHEMLSS